MRRQPVGGGRGRRRGCDAGVPSADRFGGARKAFRHHDRARFGRRVRTVLDDALLGPQVAAIDDEPHEDHRRPTGRPTMSTSTCPRSDGADPPCRRLRSGQAHGNTLSIGISETASSAIGSEDVSDDWGRGAVRVLHGHGGEAADPQGRRAGVGRPPGAGERDGHVGLGHAQRQRRVCRARLIDQWGLRRVDHRTVVDAVGLVRIWFTAATARPFPGGVADGVEGEDRAPDLEDPQQDQHEDGKTSANSTRACPRRDRRSPDAHGGGSTVICVAGAQSDCFPVDSDCDAIV